MNGEGLGDPEGPDELESVQALSAGLVAVDLRESRVDGWVGGTRPSMWANRKKPRTACIIVTTEESINPKSPSWRM